MIDPSFSAVQDSQPLIYRAGRRLKLSDRKWAEKGDPVYGAENWPRVDAWERARYLVRV